LPRKRQINLGEEALSNGVRELRRKEQGTYLE
jgi:hypothetical protein